MSHKSPEARKAYSKSRYEANEDRIKAYARAYYASHRQERRAYNETHKEQRRAYLDANKERIAAQNKANREAKKEDRAAKAKVYYESHKDEIAVRGKSYNEAHRHERRAKWLVYGAGHRKETRDRYLQRKFKISTEAYNIMLENQGNACAICRTLNWRGKYKVPHIDHDHITGRVRGILCSKCNAALGMVNDNPSISNAMTVYLIQHSAAQQAAKEKT